MAALAGKHLACLVIEDDRIVGKERLLIDQEQRIRHAKQRPDDALWVVTDEAAGRLLPLARVRTDPGAAQDDRRPSLALVDLLRNREELLS